MADNSDEQKVNTKDVNERIENKRKRLLSDGNHVLRKRVPFGLTRCKPGEIYVTNKTNFKAQLNKCEKLFDSGATEIIIHGLGAAINRACTLALELKEIHFGTLELNVKTATVTLVDDFEPLNDDADYETTSRHNSAVHIRVFRKAVIGNLKYE